MSEQLPAGYTIQTKCCMRCIHLFDCSHPDGLELYCNKDGALTLTGPVPQISDEGYDEFIEKRMLLKMPRSVEAWGTCPCWEQRKGECKHGRIGYCGDCNEIFDSTTI